MRWMDAHGINFITGLSPNNKLKGLFALAVREAEIKFRRTGWETRGSAAAHYVAGTWERTRRVICRVLVSGKGTDVCLCVVSFTEAGAKYLYETVYCDRGRMEQMIKDHKTALKSDRTRCHRKEANPFRLFIHSANCLNIIRLFVSKSFTGDSRCRFFWERHAPAWQRKRGPAGA